MEKSLLCLNPEWQGCESPILESGAKKLAKELFGNRVYIDIGTPKAHPPQTRDGVFLLDTIYGQFLRTVKLLEEKSPQRVMTVGGSCGIDVAPVTYLNSLYEGDLAVIWFDAHGDLNTPGSSPSGHFHGMVLRTLLGDGAEMFCKQQERTLKPCQVFLAGVRDLDGSEKEYIEYFDIPVCEINDQLIDFVARSGFKNVYIHLDVDVISPDDFLDALMPTSGGPTCEQVSSCLSSLNDRFNIVGLSIVEYCGEHEGSASQIVEMLRKARLIS